jgi:predicted transposase/invertase (TIGR01784 family)
MSTLKDKYINPLTDFGFKKLFGTEWLYVFRHLSNLQDRPQKLQERIFQKLFEAAEIAKFSPEERDAYEDSLKYYRDLKNVVDTSREEGILEGIEKRNFEIVKKMKEKGMPNSEISELTGLSDVEINDL